MICTPNNKKVEGLLPVCGTKKDFLAESKRVITKDKRVKG